MEICFFVGIATSVVATILVLGCQRAYRYTQEVKSPFTGSWDGLIYDESGEIIKRDQYELRQRGETISGKISRQYPPGTKRAWRTWGRIRDQNYFAVFWSTNAGILSYGCWYMRQRNENRFEGYYLKFHEGDARRSPKIATVRIDLVRQRSHRS